MYYDKCYIFIVQIFNSVKRSKQVSNFFVHLLIVTSDILQVSANCFFDIFIFFIFKNRNIQPAAIDGGVFSDIIFLSIVILHIFFIISI